MQAMLKMVKLDISALKQAYGKKTNRKTRPETANAKPGTIDHYLSIVSTDQRSALEALRKAIHSVVPKAEECISYGLPAFRLDGRMLVSFGATRNHCAFYLMSSSTLEACKDALKDYDTSKGTIRFQANNPLPARLVGKLVKARIAENDGHN